MDSAELALGFPGPPWWDTSTSGLRIRDIRDGLLHVVSASNPLAFGVADPPERATNARHRWCVTKSNCYGPPGSVPSARLRATPPKQGVTSIRVRHSASAARRRAASSRLQHGPALLTTEVVHGDFASIGSESSARVARVRCLGIGTLSSPSRRSDQGPTRNQALSLGASLVRFSSVRHRARLSQCAFARRVRLESLRESVCRLSKQEASASRANRQHERFAGAHRVRGRPLAAVLRCPAETGLVSGATASLLLPRLAEACRVSVALVCVASTDHRTTRGRVVLSIVRKTARWKRALVLPRPSPISARKVRASTSLVGGEPSTFKGLFSRQRTLREASSR